MHEKKMWQISCNPSWSKQGYFSNMRNHLDASLTINSLFIHFQMCLVYIHKGMLTHRLQTFPRVWLIFLCLIPFRTSISNLRVHFVSKYILANTIRKKAIFSNSFEILGWSFCDTSFAAFGRTMQCQFFTVSSRFAYPSIQILYKCPF